MQLYNFVEQFIQNSISLQDLHDSLDFSRKFTNRQKFPSDKDLM